MRKYAIVGALAILASLLMVIPALATHGQQVIPGGTSIFEIDNAANLVVDDDGNDDWESIPEGDTAGTERRKSDTASGPTDESFVQGTKEDTAIPVVETGSIPPNKSDLLTFGGYLETTAAGDKYLNIFWHRVQEPQGTTNMDFEFNANLPDPDAGNGITPIRSEGDILIQYDLSQGGTNPTLWISRWVTDGPNSQCEANGGKVPCWSDKVNLTAAGDAVGSINTSEIVDDPDTTVDETDGLGTISPRTFGEAQIDFDAFSGGGCVGFGSAYLKSRSSDSFTSALKDFIPPLELNFNECGALKITKTVKVPGAGTTGQEGVNFIVTNSADEEVFSGPTDADGEICLTGLEADDYTVLEDPVPTGYVAAGDNPQTKAVAADGSTCGDDPFTGTLFEFENTPLTDLTVTAEAQVDGATKSTISCVDDSATPVKVIDVSTPVDPATGTATGLEPGTYTCTVVIDP